MPGTPITSGKPFLSIVGGNFSQKVKEGTPGATCRKWEIPNGASGEKWEFIFKEWEGRIVSIKFKDSDFGKSCDVELEDAVVSLNTEARFFPDFAKKIFPADLSKSISFAPYDFEGDDSKKIVGITMRQGNDKLANHFYDGEKKEAINGMPTTESGVKYDKDDWKTFFIKVKKFLISEVEKLEIPYFEPKVEEDKTLTVNDLKNAGTPDAKAKVAAAVSPTDEKVVIDDLPF